MGCRVNLGYYENNPHNPKIVNLGRGVGIHGLAVPLKDQDRRAVSLNPASRAIVAGPTRLGARY